MLKMNCGKMPMANIRSVTGTMTSFSLRMRSEKPLQRSTSGPTKSDCIARMKVTAVKRRPSTAIPVNEAATAKEPLKIRNSPMNPLSPGKPSDENIATLIQPQSNGVRCMIAYLSIKHLGYCLLGLFAITARPVLSGVEGSTSSLIDMHAALSGVFLQIFHHGLTAAALFYFVGLLEQRRGLRGIDDFGGLMQRTPLLCGWMSVAMFSSLGLPGLNGFVGEFLIFKGSFATAACFTAIAVLGLLFTAVTFMRAMQALFSGPLAESCGGFSDLVRGEKFVIVPVTLLMFAIGISPQFIFNIFNATVVQMARLFA